MEPDSPNCYNCYRNTELGDIKYNRGLKKRVSVTQNFCSLMCHWLVGNFHSDSWQEYLHCLRRADRDGDELPEQRLVHRRGELGAPAPSWDCCPCPWEGSRTLARRQGLALLPFTPTTPRGTFFSSPAIIFPHPYCCAPFFLQPGGRRPLVLCAMHYADFISASNTYTALHYDWIIFCHRYVADRTIFFLPSFFL